MKFWRRRFTDLLSAILTLAAFKRLPALRGAPLRRPRCSSAWNMLIKRHRAF
ncbi:MAG: hypothetical protein M3Q78_07325 [Acidobacteriota bacterium]|nr:hypothetical protein [Acidobacteriota bacterium]